MAGVSPSELLHGLLLAYQYAEKIHGQCVADVITAEIRRDQALQAKNEAFERLERARKATRHPRPDKQKLTVHGSENIESRDKPGTDSNIKSNRVDAEGDRKTDKSSSEIDRKVDKVSSEKDHRVDKVNVDKGHKVDRVNVEKNQIVEKANVEVGQKVEKVNTDRVHNKLDNVSLKKGQKDGEVSLEKYHKVDKVHTEKLQKVEKANAERHHKEEKVNGERDHKVDNVSSENEQKVEKVCLDKVQKIDMVTSEKDHKVDKMNGGSDKKIDKVRDLDKVSSEKDKIDKGRSEKDHTAGKINGEKDKKVHKVNVERNCKGNQESPGRHHTTGRVGSDADQKTDKVSSNKDKTDNVSADKNIKTVKADSDKHQTIDKAGVDKGRKPVKVSYDKEYKGENNNKVERASNEKDHRADRVNGDKNSRDQRKTNQKFVGVAAEKGNKSLNDILAHRGTKPREMRRSICSVDDQSLLNDKGPKGKGKPRLKRRNSDPEMSSKRKDRKRSGRNEAILDKLLKPTKVLGISKGRSREWLEKNISSETFNLVKGFQQAAFGTKTNQETKKVRVHTIVLTDEWNDLVTSTSEIQEMYIGKNPNPNGKPSLRDRAAECLVNPPQKEPIALFMAPKKETKSNDIFYAGHWRVADGKMLKPARAVKGQMRQTLAKFEFVGVDLGLVKALNDDHKGETKSAE